MRLEVHPILEDDFPEMVSAQWTSFESPFSGLIRAAAPIFNNDRVASLATSVDVQLAQHRTAQPESHWIKVVDTDANGKLVGAAQWFIYERNPFEKAEEFVADWWPEVLHIAFTIPEYRRRGVGNMLMEWGTQKADSLSLECWLDASDYGRPLYEKHGFIYIMDHFLEPDIDEKGLSDIEKEELKNLRESMLPIHVAAMWRPKGGRYIEGMTEKPWETDVNEP
ncbi:hypothetical protein PRK78_002242 [Emydomyces testavorans]|uniref:N-acetyltransferase domain-containing protein n=1 Tax=Emydomyces testavorans TaxID=2070801 RepID=A0AAF0IHF0_9EURO|nr:hypothetical protein PRK78_002242 [Emydomyces testavorans]